MSVFKYNPNSRLGKKRIAAGQSLTVGDPATTRADSREMNDDEIIAIKLHFVKGDYLVVTDGQHSGIKGVAVWVGVVQSGQMRVGVKPLRGELVMCDVEDVRKEEGRIG